MPNAQKAAMIAVKVGLSGVLRMSAPVNAAEVKLRLALIAQWKSCIVVVHRQGCLHYISLGYTLTHHQTADQNWQANIPLRVAHQGIDTGRSKQQPSGETIVQRTNLERWFSVV